MLKPFIVAIIALLFVNVFTTSNVSCNENVAEKDSSDVNTSQSHEKKPNYRHHRHHHHHHKHNNSEESSKTTPEYDVHRAGAQIQMGQIPNPSQYNDPNLRRPPNFRMPGVKSNNPDNWERIPYLFQTYNEPESYYLMPLLSNGYLGTTAFNDSIYVNGLYNGRGEKSHRVRIPAMNSIYAYFDSMVATVTTTYTLDCRRGVYVKEMRTINALMYQRYYVHRQRNIVVNEIRVELLNNADYAVVELYNITKLNYDYVSSNNVLVNPNKYPQYYQENDPEDMLYEQKAIRQPTQISQFATLNDGIYHLKSSIPETEIENKQRKDVHVVYTNVPSKLYVYRNESIKTFHFILSVDKDFFRAQSAYEEAIRTAQTDPNSLFNSHTSAWEDVWQKNGFAMVGESNVFASANQDDFKVAQRLYASFYNLYASLPYKLSWAQDSQFYGLSPAGLAYGALRPEYYNTTSNTIPSNRQFSEGYGGHVTYHQDFWILPIISLFSQDMSKSIIQSRLRRGLNNDHINILDQARENAKDESAEGVRYAWQQGDYGKDLAPSPDVRKKRIHVTGSVGFGLRSYLRMSHDRDFLLNTISSDVGIKGEDFINEIAKYWNSKLKLSTNRNMYEIQDIIFGDQNLLRDVNNEAFTNYISKVCLNTYEYALRLTDKDPYDSVNSYRVREYNEKIDRLYMPYDGNRRVYLEFDGFNTGQQNYETWVPYLNYPLQMPLDYIDKKNVLDTYAQQVSSEGKNTMTYASLVAGYLEINEENKARDYFNRLSAHFNGPFMVMSEYPNTINNPSNTFSYLPGYASYIHAFIGGFSAVRVRDYQIDIIYPSLKFANYISSSSSPQSLPIKSPYPSLDYWNITGLSYRGFEIDIVFNLRAKTLSIKNRKLTDGYQISNTKPLEIIFYENEQKIFKQLNIGETQTFNLNTALWATNTNTNNKKKPKTIRRDYPDNIDVLATIFPTNFRNYIILDSGANSILAKYVYLFFSLTVSFLFYKF